MALHLSGGLHIFRISTLSISTQQYSRFEYYFTCSSVYLTIIASQRRSLGPWESHASIRFLWAAARQRTTTNPRNITSAPLQPWIYLWKERSVVWRHTGSTYKNEGAFGGVKWITIFPRDSCGSSNWGWKGAWGLPTAIYHSASSKGIE